MAEKTTIRLYAAGSWTQKWSKSISTSCLSSDFSPDGRQVVFGMSWYQGDGATARIYEVSTGNGVDNIVQPQPGVTAVLVMATIADKNDGLSWSPDGSRIAQAFGRNDEGFYIWFADLDPDNDGWNTSDQGDGRTDAFTTMALNGMILITTDLETIHYPLPKEMHVQTLTEQVSKTGSVAPMAMVTGTLTKEMYSQRTTNNGLILILMDEETITTTMCNHLLNCT